MENNETYIKTLLRHLLHCTLYSPCKLNETWVHTHADGCMLYVIAPHLVQSASLKCIES